MIGRSIEKTNTAVKTFLQKELQKMVKHEGCQTMSIEDLFVDYNEKIKDL